MARNGSGIYSPPLANVVSGTTIDPTHFNTTIADISTALSESLPVDGQRGMSGPFRLASGSAALPAFGFNAEPSTGLYYPGTGVMGFAVAAAERMRLNASGNLIIGTMSDGGQKLQVNGTSALAGNTAVTGTFSASGAATLSSTLAVAGATTITGSNNLLQVVASDEVGTVLLGTKNSNASSVQQFFLSHFGADTYIGNARAGLLSLWTNGVSRLSISSAGAVNIAGALTTAGLTTASAGLTVTGAATISTTLGVTGASTLAGLSATTGSFSSTLGVSGASTLAALSATTGTFSSAISATTGTFSGAISASNIVTGAGVASRIVQADGSGYIHNTYFNSTDNSAGSGISAVMCKVSDNYLRSGTAAAVATFLSGSTMNIAGNSTTTSQTTIGRMVGSGVTHGSYGSISVTGATGGYAGIAFNDHTATFMVNGTLSGMYRNNASWDWYFTSGVLTVGTVPGTQVTGTVPAATTAGSCSGNAATVSHNAGRTDGTAYPIVWMSGTGSPAYSCSAVTITSGSGLINCSALTASGEVTAFSDARVKTNIETISNALDKVSALRGVTYNRTDEAHLGQRGTGVIAQELQTVLPEAVREDADGMLSVAYGNVIGLLIEAIKELKAEVSALKAA